MAKLMKKGSGIVQTEQRWFSFWSLRKVVVVHNNGSNLLREVHRVSVGAHPCARTFAAARKVIA